MGLEFQLPESRRHSPVGSVWVLLAGGDLALDLLDLLEHSALALRHLLNICSGDFGGDARAEEQLQEQFVARNLGLRCNGEPGLQTLQPFRGDGVDLLVGSPLLFFRFADNSSVGSQTFQVRINLSVALVPEETDGGADGLAQVVAGHGLDVQQTEQNFQA